MIEVLGSISELDQMFELKGLLRSLDAFYVYIYVLTKRYICLNIIRLVAIAQALLSL